jgi:hypothetical protein
MKDLNGFNIPGHHFIRNKKTNAGSRMILILMPVIFILFLFSCSSKMIIAKQDRNLPSAYTHSGKYVRNNGVGKKRDGIKKENLKCHIPSSRK